VLAGNDQRQRRQAVLIDSDDSMCCKELDTYNLDSEQSARKEKGLLWMICIGTYPFRAVCGGFGSHH